MNRAKHYIDELYAIAEYDKKEGLYDSKVATSEEKVTTSYPDGGSSNANGACSDANGGSIWDSFPKDLRDRIRDRIKSFGKRVPQGILSDTIVDLCKIKPLSGEELATILGKTEPYKMNKILPRTTCYP